MAKYISKRILIMIPTILFVVFIIFYILHFMPSSPGRIILGVNAKEADVQAINDKLGYNDPVLVQYVNYVKNALTLDFGESYQYSKPVFQVLLPKFPVTLKLAFLSMIVASVIGIPVGIVSAVKKYSLADTVSTIVAMFFSSIPSFFFGVLMILLFSLKLKWLPSNGIGTWKNYIMPVLTLALPTAALLSRMTRTTMLDTMKQDYIRTAKAKGCRPSRVIFFHALRNAMMPVVTQIGMSLAGLLGGAIITEQVFGLPGFGTVCLTAIKNKDTPVIMASVLFLSVLFMLIILVVDIIYAFLDPRVMYKTVD